MFFLVWWWRRSGAPLLRLHHQTKITSLKKKDLSLYGKWELVGVRARQADSHLTPNIDKLQVEAPWGGGRRKRSSASSFFHPNGATTIKFIRTGLGEEASEALLPPTQYYKFYWFNHVGVGVGEAKPSSDPNPFT